MNGPSHASFHPQGRLLLSSALDGVRIWDSVSGRHLGQLPIKAVSAHFTPDGRGILVAGPSGITFWPVEKSAGDATVFSIGPPQTIAGEAEERRSAMTPDGRLLAATDLTRNIIELFDIASLKRTRDFQGLSRVATAVPSPDGRWCVGGSWPGADLAVWDIETGELVRKLALDGFPKFAFHPSGKSLVVNGKNRGQVFSLPDLEFEAELPPHAAGGFGFPCYSPDGRILALTRHGYLIQLLDATTLEELATLEPTQEMMTGPLAFSPDGTRLAAVSPANAIILWDLRVIRENLATMNLDWAHPPCDAPPPSELGPQIVVVRAGNSD
jgi:WD40 repeat protein